ncbi:MAG: site-specific DNA-methyltransferase [Pirellulales bacterium]
MDHAGVFGELLVGAAAHGALPRLWWLSKSENPKADVSSVLAPYSNRMKQLLKDPDVFYRPKDRPSGHDVSRAFGTDNGGAIPSNLLQYPNTESNSIHIRLCKANNIPPHPARFPLALPEFFIKFLTEPGDTVVDIFAGSNTTGEAAEALGRNWLALECDRKYVIGSAFRFMQDWSDEEVAKFVATCRSEVTEPINVLSAQRALF